MSTKRIFCLSGQRGSGRTTTANFLKKEFNAKIIHVGHILENIDEKKNLPVPIFVRRLVSKEGKEAIPKIMINDIQKSLIDHDAVVIEGVDRPEYVTEFRKYFSNASLYVIFISAKKGLRVSRLMKRNGLTKKEALSNIEKEDKVRIDLGQKSVQKMANFIILNNFTIEKLFLKLDALFFFLKKGEKKTRKLVI